jgi:hypothetical protein
VSPQLKIAVRDLRTDPFLRISKTFFALRPSHLAVCAYNSLVYFSSNRTSTTEMISIPTMAALVGVSESSFKRALAELVKKRAVRVRHRGRKTPNGQKISLPNLYEILDLTPGQDDSI